MLRLSSRQGHRLRQLLLDVSRSHAGWIGIEAAAILASPPFSTPPRVRQKLPGKSREAKKKEKRLGRREAMAKLRFQIVLRASGNCEVVGCGAVGTDLDHFRGGSARRWSNKPDGVWLLCRAHHRLKTDNDPSANYWRVEFQKHRAELAAREELFGRP